jgi:tRNA nucleotidyltransferase/poly(A) polymerase
MPKIYKVGGCVRDALLGVPTKDIDFVFILDDLNKTVQEGFQDMKLWMENEGFTIFQSVPEMYTIRAKFPKGHKFEGLDADFVMARKEIGYEEGTRRPILELGILEDDLIRRDFTINAMAEDEDGNIIDLFNGKIHLKNKVLVSPQDPNIMLMDNPLRALRALRFALTKELSIEAKLQHAMKNSDLIFKMQKVVSQECIQAELNKMFKYDPIKTMRWLVTYDMFHMPGLLTVVFANNWWVEITNKKK